jgi:hypothetical protein
MEEEKRAPMAVTYTGSGCLWLQVKALGHPPAKVMDQNDNSRQRNVRTNNVYVRLSALLTRVSIIVISRIGIKTPVNPV